MEKEQDIPIGFFLNDIGYATILYDGSPDFILVTAKSWIKMKQK